MYKVCACVCVRVKSSVVEGRPGVFVSATHSLPAI